MIAIDLGSNTIRFLASDGAQILYDKQFVVRTAEGLAKSKRVCQNALLRVITAIHTAKNEFDFSDHKILAVTTETFRQAQNSAEALQTIYDQTGISFRVISPETEAALTAKAVALSATQRGLNEPFFVLDIGGASSEVIYFVSDQTQSISFPIGIVTTTEKNLSERELIRFLSDQLKTLDEFTQGKKPNHLIATAGTPTTLAAIKQGQNYFTYKKEQVNGTTLDIDEITSLYHKLLSLDTKAQIALVGDSRADLIITGSVMLREFVKKLGFTTCVVFDEGLREGVLQALISGDMS